MAADAALWRGVFSTPLHHALPLPLPILVEDVSEWWWWDEWRGSNE